MGESPQMRRLSPSAATEAKNAAGSDAVTAASILRSSAATNSREAGVFGWASPNRGPTCARSTPPMTHTRRAEPVRVEPTDVVVVDGILLFADPRVRDLCDVKVFVDADADVRLIRRIRRDMKKRGRPLDEILEQYLTTVQPMHLEFVEPSKRYADVIVPRGGHNAVAIEMIVAKIQRRIASPQAARQAGSS